MRQRILVPPARRVPVLYVVRPIEPRRTTGLCNRCQRKLRRVVKQARKAISGRQ